MKEVADSDEVFIKVLREDDKKTKKNEE